MANPEDPGTFEYWITDRITFQDIPPLSGDTGDFESWLWDRQYWEDYVEAAAAAVGQPMMLRGTTVPHLGRQWHPRVA
jgi:hypothetical protein